MVWQRSDEVVQERLAKARSRGPNRFVAVKSGVCELPDHLAFGHQSYARSVVGAAMRRITQQAAAFRHWKDHGKEFPNLLNAKKYAEAAREFVTNPPTGVLSKTRVNGEVLFYDRATNTFAVRATDGAPRTMFKSSQEMVKPISIANNRKVICIPVLVAGI